MESSLDVSSNINVFEQSESMKFLFFFVHPSKYHLYRITINKLIEKGHEVKVLIISKDVLEALVKEEKWDYTNIFPEGRKIKGLPPKLSAVINTFRTLIRLNKYASKEKYDLYITDDLLTITGRLKKIPSILFQDDDITAVPESVLVLATATHILAPACANFKKYNSKKIGFNGYKASAYLHQNSFTPDKDILEKYDLDNKRFFIIRVVSLTATHDMGKSGISDNDLDVIIKKLDEFGEVIISSQRSLHQKFEKYHKIVKPNDFKHLIAFADLFISDSQTMSIEAGYLGTPFIRFNDFVGRISCLNELETKYELGFGIPTKDKHFFLDKIDELLVMSNLKKIWLEKRKRMLEETIDLSKFMIWLYENYPRSVQEYKKNPDIQHNFR